MEVKFYRTDQRKDDIEGRFDFLCKSFPELSYRQYQKINNGKHFKEWVYGTCGVSTSVICCAAIFNNNKSGDKSGYKMGLFCVSPTQRRKGIGTLFYNYLIETYQNLEWTAISLQSINFYRKLGAIEVGKTRSVDGREYTSFRAPIKTI